MRANDLRVVPQSNPTAVSRRALLRACLVSGMLAGMPKTSIAVPQKNDEVTPKKLGVTRLSRKKVLKRAATQMLFLNLLYGLDKSKPVSLNNGVALVRCNDPLGVLPEETEIKSVYSGETKIGQIHAMMTGVYTALHCNGKDGGVDNDLDLSARDSYDQHAIGTLIRESKVNLIDAMKMQAGIVPGNQATFQKKLTDVEAAVKRLPGLVNLMGKGTFNFDRSVNNKYSYDAAKRIGQGLSRSVEFIRSNPAGLRARKARKTISEFEDSFSRLYVPEVNSRRLGWTLRSQDESVRIGFSSSLYTSPYRMCASFNSFRILFGDQPLPKISAWLPFKKSAKPEYRIWYADKKTEYAIPMNVAYNVDTIPMTFPDLQNVRSRRIDIDSFLPPEFPFVEGAIRAFNISVGLADFGKDLRLDRVSDLEQEAKRLGVRVASKETGEQGGLLLLATAFVDNERLWGEDIWPQRNLL